ncbi:MAG: beta-carotene hydroxylase [Leptolyngbyaceae cyanobacterium SL_1_1]|nr:beta-carotene hydroxylase [Leptolyngbyaceae cyanobacterium SL_1_1]
MSVATEPLIVPRTVPSELLRAEGGISPNLLMFFSAVLLVTLSTWSYFVWDLAGWCCFCLNTLALHLVGTVIHDASHHAAHRNRVVNALLGHGSALMLGFAFPVFTRVHMQHHANVNDPENDPDHYVSTGGPLWLIAPRFFYHEVFFFKRQLWKKGRWDLLQWGLSRLLVVITFTVAIAYGYTDYLMNYWLPPACIMGLLLGLFFDYLPHRPFQDRDRWQNARVYPGWLTNILLLGQNYHLVHHLWPSVPWYKYQAAYHVAKPVLDRHHCKQNLGIWQGKEFFSFLYDAFIGIHWHSTPVDAPEVTQTHDDPPS